MTTEKQLDLPAMFAAMPDENFAAVATTLLKAPSNTPLRALIFELLRRWQAARLMALGVTHITTERRPDGTGHVITPDTLEALIKVATQFTETHNE